MKTYRQRLWLKSDWRKTMNPSRSTPVLIESNDGPMAIIVVIVEANPILEIEKIGDG